MRRFPLAACFLLFACAPCLTTGCGRPMTAPAAANVPAPAPHPAWEQQADELLDAQDPGGALTIVEPVLAKEPENVAALILRARANRHLGNHDLAMADANKAIELEPKNPLAWVAHGHALGRDGDAGAAHYAALISYDRALALNPKQSEAHYGRGLTYFLEGKYEEAVAEFTKAIELGDEDGVYHCQRGEAYTALERHAEAVDDFSEAIKINPEEDYFYSMRGYCLCELKRFDEAIADYTKTVELTPDESWPYSYRASAYVLKGDYEQGAKDWIKSIEDSDDHAGKGYQPLRETPLDEEALRHGEEQLKAILRDRPEMAEYVKPGDRLWTWAVRKLAGEDIGEPIYWNPRSMRILGASHQMPTDVYVGSIRLSADPEVRGDGDGTAFESLWSKLVFELHNITFAKHFSRVFDGAGSGRSSHEQFLIDISQVESQAGELTSAFYAHVFLPWAQEAGFRASNTQFWYLNVSRQDTAQETLNGLTASYVGFNRAHYDLNAANLHLHAGEYADARALLEGYLNEPKSLEEDDLATAHCYHGKVLLADDERNGALDAFKKAVALDDLWAEDGIVPAGARVYFGKPLTDEKKIDAAAHMLRGNAWAESGDIDAAIADYNRAIEIDPEYHAAYILRARAHLERREYDAALADVDKVLAANPENVSAIATRAGIRQAKREYEQALADYSEYIRLAPRQAWGWYSRASVYGEMGEHERAIADLNVAIQRNANDVNGVLLRAQAYGEKYDFEKAFADCAVVIAMAPESAAGYFVRGNERCVSGDVAGGMQDYEQALRLDPTQNYVRHQRVTFWNALEEYSKALAEVETLINVAPEDGATWELQAETLFELGKTDEALAAIEKAISLDQEIEAAYCTRGKIRAKRGENVQALADFDRAMELNPRSSMALVDRAIFLSECDDPSIRNSAKAIEDATKACELTYWKEERCLAALATCHAEAGDSAKAVEWQTKAIEAAGRDWKPRCERELATFQAGKTLRAAREALSGGK